VCERDGTKIRALCGGFMYFMRRTYGKRQHCSVYGTESEENTSMLCVCGDCCSTLINTMQCFIEAISSIQHKYLGSLSSFALDENAKTCTFFIVVCICMWLTDDDDEREEGGKTQFLLQYYCFFIVITLLLISLVADSCRVKSTNAIHNQRVPSCASVVKREKG
jgi:hypothetical protein